MKRLVGFFFGVFVAFSAPAALFEIHVESGSQTLTAGDVVNGPILKTGDGELVIDSTIPGLADAIQIDGGTIRVTGESTVVVQNLYTDSFRNPHWPWRNGQLIIENGATLTTNTKLFDQDGSGGNDILDRSVLVQSGATLTFTGTEAFLGSHENGGQGATAGTPRQAMMTVNAATLNLPATFTVGSRAQSAATRQAKLVIENGSVVTGTKLVVGNRASALLDYMTVVNSTVTLGDGIYLDPNNKDWSHAGILFRNSTITLAKFEANRPAHQADRSVKFDNATFVPTASSASFFKLDDTQTCNHLLAGGLTIDTAYDVTLDARFDGVGGIVKRGPATMTLLGNNLYTGTTSVEAGRVIIQGTQSGPVSVAAGASCEFTYPPEITTLTLAPGATLKVAGLGTSVQSANGYEDATITITASVWPMATPVVSSPDNAFLAALADKLNASIELGDGLEFGVREGSVQVVESGFAQKRAIWTGLGEDDNWSTDANWAGDECVRSGDNLEFDGSLRLQNVNDLGDLAVLDVNFPPTAGSFSISGSGTLTVGNGITNLAANAQTLDMPILVSAKGAFDIVAAGDVTLGAGVSAIQTGARIVKTGAGKLTVNAPGTELGLDLREGSIAVTGVAPGTPVFSTAADAIKIDGTIDAGGGAVTILDSTGTGIIAGSTLANGIFSYARTSGDSYLPWNEGQVVLDGATFTAAKLFSGGGARIEQAIPRSLVITNGSIVTITASPAYIVSRDNGDGLNDNGQVDNTTPVSVFVHGSTLNLPVDTYLSNWGVYAAARNGRLRVVDGAFVNGQNLYIGYRAGRGWLDVIDSTMSFTSSIQLIPSSYNNLYESNGNWVRFVNSTLTNRQLVVRASSYNSNAPQSVTFDAARLVACADSANFIEKPAIAPHGRLEILEGGLEIDSNGCNIAIPAMADMFGSGGLVKTGAGMLTLASTNSYQGATIVAGGALQLTGGVAGELVVGADGALVVDGTRDVPAIGAAQSATFASGSTIRLVLDETYSPDDEHPFLLIRSGVVTGSPEIEITGISPKPVRMRTQNTSDGVLCSIVSIKGTVVVIR